MTKVQAHNILIKARGGKVPEKGRRIAVDF
jgi:hypothetical protein